MGAGKNKLLLELRGIPILIHTLKVFEQDDLCDGIILVVSPKDEEIFRGLIKQFSIKKITSIAYGGEERQHSVANGLKQVRSEGIVLVHDGARPFIDIETIHQLVDCVKHKGAAVIGVPVKDTIKRVDGEEVVETVDRSSLWAIQTPQAFLIPVLKKAYEKAEQDQFIGTDEASLVERIPYPVSIVEGNYDNIKLTTIEDLYFAEAILRKREDISKKVQIFD